MLQKLGYIAPHVIFIREFINVMELPEEIKIQDIYLLNTNTIWNLLKLIGVFSYLLSIINILNWIFELVLFLLYLDQSLSLILYVILDFFTFYYCYCILDINDDNPVTYLCFNDYIDACNRLKKEGTILCKKTPILLH